MILNNSLFDFYKKMLALDHLEVPLVIGDGVENLAKKFYQSSIPALCIDTTSLKFSEIISLLENLKFKNFTSVGLYISIERIHQAASLDIFPRISYVCESNFLLYVYSSANFDVSLDLFVDRMVIEKKIIEHGFTRHSQYYFFVSDLKRKHSDSPMVSLFNKYEKKHFPVLEHEVESLNFYSSNLFDVYIQQFKYHLSLQYIKPGDNVLDVSSPDFMDAGLQLLNDLSMMEDALGVIDDTSIRNHHSLFHGKEKVKYICRDLVDSADICNNKKYDVVFIFVSSLDDVYEQLSNKKILTMVNPGGRVLVGFDIHNDEDDLSLNFLTNISKKFDYRLFLETVNYIVDDGVGLQVATLDLSTPTIECNELASTVSLFASFMHTPFIHGVSYTEKVYKNIYNTEHPSISYAKYFLNPNLIYSMISVEYRVKNKSVLKVFAKKTIDTYPVSSCDFAAAACVYGYIALDSIEQSEIEWAIEQASKFIDSYSFSPMHLRWLVSLLFIRAKLFESIGKFNDAKQDYISCSEIDASTFGIHIYTKITEAAYSAGKMEFITGRMHAAYNLWFKAIRLGQKLLSASLDDILIDSEYPNLFNHGDGIREFTIAWDNLSKAANGLHIIKNKQRPLSIRDLNTNFQFEYLSVNEDLKIERQDLAQYVRSNKLLNEEILSIRNLLELRNKQSISLLNNITMRDGEIKELSRKNDALSENIDQLNTTLSERDRQSNLLLKDISIRDAEIQELRTQNAVQLTNLGLLNVSLLQLNEQSVVLLKDLSSRDAELSSVRAELELRTKNLEFANAELENKTESIEVIHVLLSERTQQAFMLQQSNEELSEDLVNIRRELESRTNALEALHSVFDKQKNELLSVRDLLRERTSTLEFVTNELAERTNRLNDYVKMHTALYDKLKNEEPN